MTEQGPTKLLRVDLAQAFAPDSRVDREVLCLLIALECFTAVDEAFLSASFGDVQGESGRKYIFYLLKAGYLAEAYRAFIYLDQRGWFDQNPSAKPEKRAKFNAALLRLRGLSPEDSQPPEACRCCGKVHNDWPKVERRPPAALLRLRDKAGFHWDSAAVRDAYRRLLKDGTQPAVFRFVGRRILDVESPLAAALLSHIIEDTDGLEADIHLVLEVSRHLRLITQTALAVHLHRQGATLEVEDP